MPLRKGKSKATIQANIKELVSSKPSSARAKGITTLAHRSGTTKGAAKRKQAIAIAYSKAKK